MDYFQPALNKENASQLGVLASVRGPRTRTGPAGKTYQPAPNHRSSLVQKKALGTIGSRNLAQGCAPVTRKALGGLNVDPTPHKQNKGGVRTNTRAEAFLKPPVPASRPLTARHARARHQDKKVTLTHSAQKKRVEDHPPIEHMPKAIEKEDTFEDIWPTKERPDSFIEEMLQWRPARIFSRPDWDVYRDHDDHDSLLQDTDDSSTEELRVQDLTIEDPEIQLTWEAPDFSEIVALTLPPLDGLDLALPPLDDLDLALPPLDDLDAGGAFDMLH